MRKSDMRLLGTTQRCEASAICLALAQLPLPEILARVDAVPGANRQEADAVLGAGGTPEITVTGALDLFWDLADERTTGKSVDQIRRRRNPRVKAVANFVAVIGDVPLREMTGEHMLDFREWWWDKIKSEGLTTNSGNKDFKHVGNVFRTVNKLN